MGGPTPRKPRDITTYPRRGRLLDDLLSTLNPVRWWLLMAFAGCGFDLQAPAQLHDAPRFDAAVDARPSTPPVCTTNPAYTAGGPQAGHTYRLSSVTGSFDAVVASCAADGAHAVTVETTEENSFLVSLAAGSTPWLGLHDLNSEGRYQWTSGSSSGFRAYGATEPNDFGTEDCTTLTSSGTWNDSGCGQNHRGVCECDPGYLAPSLTTCRAVAGGMSFEGRVYHVRLQARDWVAAEADCVAIGSHLAVPGDEDENARIDISFPGDSWIGLSDRAVSGSFVWVNGAPSTGYTRWGTSQPSGEPGEDCVAIDAVLPPGGWDDDDCSTGRPYACECEPLTR